MKKGLIGKKVGMTQIFDESGKVIPVTVIEAGPCVVAQVKTEEKDGYIYYKTPYAFCYKDERASFGKHHWDNFVGWKFQDVEQDVERCMLAFRITPFQ